MLQLNVNIYAHESKTSRSFNYLRLYIPAKTRGNIWPASHEKGPSDISHSVDQDQPLYDVENTYT